MKRRAVFLDRDGVLNDLALNEKTGCWESPHDPKDVRLTQHAAQAVRALCEAGYLVFVVSNQPSYAKGKTSLENLRLVHDCIEAGLANAGGRVEKYYYCYHHPQGTVAEYSGPCKCRKPEPYFLLEARREYNLDMDASWMVGDRDTDVQCGRAAGVKTVLVTDSRDSGRRGVSTPDFTVTDIREAAGLIIKLGKTQ